MPLTEKETELLLVQLQIKYLLKIRAKILCGKQNLNFAYRILLEKLFLHLSVLQIITWW